MLRIFLHVITLRIQYRARSNRLNRQRVIDKTISIFNCYFKSGIYDEPLRYKTRGPEWIFYKYNTRHGNFIF